MTTEQRLYYIAIQEASIRKLKEALAGVALVIKTSEFPLGFPVNFFDEVSFLDQIADMTPDQGEGDMEVALDVMDAEFALMPTSERRDSYIGGGRG
jgi:hypothetical protein